MGKKKKKKKKKKKTGKKIGIFGFFGFFLRVLEKPKKTTLAGGKTTNGGSVLLPGGQEKNCPGPPKLGSFLFRLSRYVFKKHILAKLIRAASVRGGPGKRTKPAGKKTGENGKTAATGRFGSHRPNGVFFVWVGLLPFFIVVCSQKKK